jgi:exodeoxyribonuclease III
MRIVSWNVNGIRAVERKENLGSFLEKYHPDIFCIQETKAQEEQLDEIDKKYDTYQKYYQSAEKRGYSGTSIWVKNTYSVLQTSVGMPGWNDSEGRVLRVDLENCIILTIYFPNGGKSPEAWEEKLRFYDHFLEYVEKLRAEQNKNIIFCGDMNVAHHPIDIARPEDNEGRIGFHPREREWMTRVIEHGWQDVFRAIYPNTKDSYTWWHMRTRARLRNVGWRIDYFFTHKSYFDRVEKIEHLDQEEGSDHCPILLEIKE